MGEDFWQGVLYLHLVAMAFFVGGQLVVGIAVVPVERKHADPARLRAIARRFGVASVVALAVLLATGVAMASHYGLWDSTTLHAKLALVGVVVLLTLAHLRFPRLHLLQAAILIASLVIVWLGLELVT